MSALLERVRRPEFTGANRCWPCTVVNGMLLWFGVTVLTVLGQPLVALAAAGVGLAAIALRGYLVPYTPRFAPQLVSLLPGDPFDHDRGPGSLADAESDEGAEPPSGEAVLEALREAGVATLEDDEVTIDRSVRGDWREEMARLRTLDIEGLAAVADEVTPAPVTARGKRRWGTDYVVLDAESRPPVLLSKPKAVVELGAALALESRVDDERIRLAAGRPFRTLLERCPLCEGDLTVSASACCGDVTPIGSTPSEKLLCPECRATYYTFD